MIKKLLARVLPWLLFVWFALSGCKGSLLSPDSSRVERFECQVRALEPLVGEVYDSRALLQDLMAGKASLGAILANLKASQAEAAELMAALRACEPPVELPADAGEAS